MLFQAGLWKYSLQLFRVWRSYFECLLRRAVAIPSRAQVNTYSGCYSGEMFFKKTANKLDQARVDTSAHCFWLTGQVDFFHVRVFNPTVKQRVNQELHKSYKVNEKEIKKQYNERILLFEHGAFTPLVLSAALVARIKIFMPAFQR